MTEKELGTHINNFVKLNPKQNKYLNFAKYNQNSFFTIQNKIKENKKYIITSNYDDIFYNKNSKLSGKKWIEIILSSKDIFEYNKRIRDDFPYCKSRKLIKILLDDLFYYFQKNPQNAVIEDLKLNFEIEIRKDLEKIRYFLEKKDWSNYFFNLQKLMHEQIIQFLSWEKKSFEYETYNKILSKILNSKMKQKFTEEDLKFVQKVNIYRNTLSKASVKMLPLNKEIIEEWKTLSDLEKSKVAWNFYCQLGNFIITINLIKK